MPANISFKTNLRTMQTLSFLFFPFSKTVSPRNNCSSSIWRSKVEVAVLPKHGI